MRRSVRQILSYVYSILMLISILQQPIPAYASVSEPQAITAEQESVDENQEAALLQMDDQTGAGTDFEAGDSDAAPKEEDLAADAGTEAQGNGLEQTEAGSDPEIGIDDMLEPEGEHSGMAAETGVTDMPAQAETEIGAETEQNTATISEEEHTEKETEADVTERESESDLQPLADEGSGLNVNKSYVSGLAIKSLSDGIEPFDADDGAGDDSGPHNHIIRTFDSINYTLEYTTALKNTAETVDEAYMLVEFTLDCDPVKAEFNRDTLNWCLDKKITYYYSDGTVSDAWDSSRLVEKQILTGKRYLSMNGDRNAIPGVGTLSVGIYVKAAQNKDTICPDFRVWMEGNEEDLYRTTAGEAVTVSAAPRYNIKLAKNSNCNYLGYFNPDGTANAGDTAGSAYGRLEGYALVLQLYNTMTDKGLKGIELPAGEIAFDLTVTETLDDEDVTGSADYAPILWDYRVNMGTSESGELGRQMIVGGKNTTSYGSWAAPYNSGGAKDKEFSCYNGGSIAITQDAECANVYHVSIKDYTFDLEHFVFPTNNCGNTSGTLVYGANIGCFAAGYVQFVCQFARNVDTTSNLYFAIEADNLHAVSISGQATDTDQNVNDNKNGMNVTLYPRGGISKRNYFYTNTGAQIASVWSYGDSYAYPGQKLWIRSVLDYGGDNYLTSVNILQKFDDKAFEIPAGTDTYANVSYSNKQTQLGSIRVLFAAKPDGSGWVDEKEMNATREEQLVYFDKADTLKAAGYICVGYLYEIRDSKIYQGAGDAVAVTFNMPVDVRKSAQINTVYQTTNDVRAWHDAPNVLSWCDVQSSGGRCGLGDSSWEQGNYLEGYIKPSYTLYSDYGKSVYQDGSIVAGHTGGYISGNSLLIIGCKTGVSIQVADTTETAAGTAQKSVYDLDAGERTAAYVIHPSVSVVSANSEVETSGALTDVTVKAILPKGLAYIMDSASMTPLNVTENEDGSSTVSWLIKQQQVGTDMSDITFSCIIGAAGTPEDVQNNDTLTIAASITSDQDLRTINTKHGNYSETTVSVIRLAASSISKAVEKSLVEEGEEITYILRYGNSAEEDVAGVRLYDILPFNGDGRGTAFSGNYLLDTISIDFSDAKDTYEEVKESLRVLVTSSEKAREASAAEAALKKKTDLSWKQLPNGILEGQGISWSGLSLDGAVGVYFDIGTVKAQEYLKIKVNLKTKDADGFQIPDASGLVQKPGDLYVNSFWQFADHQVALVESNTVMVQVAERTVSGLAWVDQNGNGIRETSEPLLPGMMASIYRTTGSARVPQKRASYTLEGVSLYSAYDVLGNPVEAVRTKKDGSYSFSGLEPGTYYVVFTDTDGYGLTAKDVGPDDSLDSDASAEVSEDGSRLLGAYISGIALPALEDMYSYCYTCEHNDTGLLSYACGFTIRKTEEETGTALEGAVFVMQNEDGKYLAFDENHAYTGMRGKVKKACCLVTEADGTVKVEGLPVGSYTLSEYQAPQGYRKASETWNVIVKAVAQDGWTTYVAVDGERIEDTFCIGNKPVLTSVTVDKAWKDNHNQDGIRGDVILHLSGTATNADGKKEQVIEKKGVIRSDALSQSYAFTELPAFAYGQPISYAVAEEDMNGYTASYSQTDGDWEKGYHIVVTNVHGTQVTEYKVQKVWKDEEDRDGIRPEAVEVRLHGSDGSERTAKFAAEDGWSYTFTELPVFWKEGKPITYTLEETPVTGYVRKVSSGETGGQFIVTNTHEVQKTDISVIKEWEDADNQDGIRPKDIEVVLTGSDGSRYTAKLDEGNKWRYIFSDVPVYFNGGRKIEYSLQEIAVDGYSDEVVKGEDSYSFIVTNNHQPALTDVAVRKVWDDEDDQDGIRPDKIQIKLSGTDGHIYEAELHEGNGFAYLFTGLPVYYNGGKKIVYSLEESKVDEYESAVAVDDTGYVFCIKNTYKPKVTDISVTKVWEDADNQDGIRPESVQVVLRGSNGKEYPAELNADNDWSCLYTELPVYWKKGTPVKYVLEELQAEGYESNIGMSKDGKGFVLTNIHKPETTRVSVSKEWKDDTNRDGIRPERIHVTLAGSDGRKYETDIAAGNGWKVIFENLPVYYNQGEKIVYSVLEESMDGYEASQEMGEDGYTFFLTNTHEIQRKDISVQKEWEDADNQDGARPKQIEVILIGSDGIRYEAVLDEEHDWAYTFTGLPVYWDGGKTIEYSLLEKEIGGYCYEIVKSDDGLHFTVTNNHIPAVTDIVVRKEWDDGENQDGIRPKKVHISVTGSDGNTYKADLTAKGGYAHVFTDLPVFWNKGEKIIYSVEENEVSKYTSRIESSLDGYCFVITNSYTPQVKDVKVTKIWDDQEDKDGLRKDVALTLTGSDGSAYNGVIARDAVEQAFTFTGLPVYSSGKEIAYTLAEDTMDGYSSRISENEGGFTVTNTRVPETPVTEIPSVILAEAPQTGDNSTIGLWILVALVALTCGIGLAIHMLRCKAK